MTQPGSERGRLLRVSRWAQTTLGVAGLITGAGCGPSDQTTPSPLKPAAASSSGPAPPASSRPPAAVSAPALTIAAPGAEDALLFGGDVSVARGVGQALLRGEAIQGFAGLEPVWSQVARRVVNLESQLVELGGVTQDPAQPLVFAGPPQAGPWLEAQGVDVAGLGNNHQWDYGWRGLRETLATLRGAGIASVGASLVPHLVGEPLRLPWGRDTVSLFAFTAIWNQSSDPSHPARSFIAGDVRSELAWRIGRERRAGRLVVVLVHSGAEYVAEPDPGKERLFRFLVASGAQLVVGHHPHVPQAADAWGEGRVFYSLGNLLFAPRAAHRWTDFGYLVRWRRPDGARRVTDLCPYRWVDGGPRLFGSAGSRELAAGPLAVRWSELLGRGMARDLGDGCWSWEPRPP